MPQGIPYALGAMVCYGCADLLYKRAAGAGIKADQFLMAQAWFFAPIVWIYAVLSGTLEVTRAAWWGALAGLCLYGALYNFAYSLRQGTVSIHAPIFRLSFVLTATLAVLLLGEPLTALKGAGLAAALAAVWLLLGGAQSGARASASSIGRVLVASAALGISNFAHKLGVMGGASPATLLAAQAAVFISLATVVGWRSAGGVGSARPALPYGATAAVLLVLGFMWLLEGLRHGEASVLVPVSQMGFVVTALLGAMCLREGLTARKCVGLGVALVALACLAAS
jgi:drug/metabolite transporter (DMT)-like permease